MKAGRKPDADPSVRWDLYIPSTLAASVELLLKDPVRQKVKYGARSELIEELLRGWINDRVSNRTALVTLEPGQAALLVRAKIPFRFLENGMAEISRNVLGQIAFAGPQPAIPKAEDPPSLR